MNYSPKRTKTEEIAWLGPPSLRGKEIPTAPKRVLTQIQSHLMALIEECREERGRNLRQRGGGNNPMGRGGGSNHMGRGGRESGSILMREALRELALENGGKCHHRHFQQESSWMVLATPFFKFVKKLLI